MAGPNDFPYAETLAAKMLSDGIDNAKSNNDESLRMLASRLGYRSAVVLSHMRSGRIPIPVDRAPEIALVVGLDQSDFILAVLRQRFPGIDFATAATGSQASTGRLQSKITAQARLVEDIEQLSGRPIENLRAEVQMVIREVAADPTPRRRWLSIAELTAVEMLRRLRPEISTEGLCEADLFALMTALCERRKPS